MTIFVIVDRGSRSVEQTRRAITSRGSRSSARSACWSSTRFWAWGYLRSDPSPGGRRRGASSDCSIGVAIGLLRSPGAAGAAFVSDWFIDALDPAVASLGISKAFAGLVIVGDRRQRGGARHQHLPRGEGQVGPGDLDGEELRRPDRGLPLPGAGPDLDPCSSTSLTFEFRPSTSAPSS